jgi:hypothetical protein
MAMTTAINDRQIAILHEWIDDILRLLIRTSLKLETKEEKLTPEQMLYLEDEIESEMKITAPLTDCMTDMTVSFIKLKNIERKYWQTVAITAIFLGWKFLGLDENYSTDLLASKMATLCNGKCDAKNILLFEKQMIEMLYFEELPLCNFHGPSVT